MVGALHQAVLHHRVASIQMPTATLQPADKKDRMVEVVEATAEVAALLLREAPVMGNGEMVSMCLGLRT